MNNSLAYRHNGLSCSRWRNAPKKMASIFHREDTNEIYGVLDTTMKLRYHEDKIRPMLDGAADTIAPITIHFAPTLRCPQRCFFCTYGGAKKDPTQLDMKLLEAQHYISRLSELGSEGIIFTGGGDPCMHKELGEMVETCKQQGLAFALQTNGDGLTPQLAERILRCDPVYVRISINAGNGQQQRLMTGVDNYEKVLGNLESLLRKKHDLKSNTEIAVATVVDIVNYTGLINLADRLLEMEDRITADYKTKTQINWTIRPVYNYPASKVYNEYQLKSIICNLNTRSIDEAKAFNEFMYNGQQTPQYILDKAVHTIEYGIKPLIKERNSEIRVCYPLQKFKTLGTIKEKPYTQCRAPYFYGFVWPDGVLYPCVENAGNSNFAICNLKNTDVKDILQLRKGIIEKINNECLSKCSPICAYHEINMHLNNLANAAETYCPADKNNLVRRDVAFI
ncbi:hypothetical protein FACS1894190_06670 [Spirochaetia bacterium]|nr:hypothetical protein FACS1894190_06670 [Spirochaetia bacterium]